MRTEGACSPPPDLLLIKHSDLIWAFIEEI